MRNGTLGHGVRLRPVRLVLTLAVVTACASRGTTVTTSGGDVAMSGPRAEMYTARTIAAVTSAINQGEIQTSQLALQRSHNEQIHAYARMMIDQHGRLEQQEAALLSQMGLMPMDNALSIALKRSLEPVLDTLGSHSGPAFDREYILHMIATHALALHTLDTTLIPEARDPAIRAMLVEQVRPAVASHLARVKEMHQRMFGMPAPGGGP